jgi:hypothetical protein
MAQKIYSIISGILFALVALVHLGKIIQGWDVVVAGTIMPVWTSWVAMVITGILAFFGFKLGLESDSAANKF